MVSKDLLKILACPKCKGEIKEQGMFLVCNKCKLAILSWTMFQTCSWKMLGGLKKLRKRNLNTI